MKTAIKLTLGTMLAASVAAPAQAELWDRIAVTGTATYTEASNNGLSMGDLYTVNPAGVEGGRRAFFVEPEHVWDYGAAISYRVGNGNASHDTRLYIDYDHFREDHERQAAGLRNIGINSTVIATDAFADVRHRAHQLRVGVLQTVHFGSKLDVSLNGFFDYTKLERKMEEIMRLSNNVHTRSTEDELRGYGLGFGGSARGTPLNACPEFGIFGGINGTLLYSDQEYIQAMYTSTGGAAPALNYQFNPEDSKSIVVKLDAEAGIDYKRVVNSDMARFLVHAAVGVRLMNVVNAHKSGNTSFEPAVLNNAVAGNFAKWTGHPYDFGRVGPFLRLTIGGADA